MKITISWGRNDTFDSGRSKFHNGKFSGGVNEYVSHKCFGGQLGIILGDNPAGHCFVLTNLVPMSFFK